MLDLTRIIEVRRGKHIRSIIRKHVVLGDGTLARDLCSRE
jgi:hypothetical protein